MVRWISIFLAFITLSSCSSRISIPALPLVDKIIVTDGHGEQVVTVTDPKRIADVVSFLHGHDTGWHSPPGTFPTGEYTVAFESSGAFQYVVWMSLPSANWIGFRSAGKTSPDNVLRDISSTEYADLLTRLGIPSRP